MSEKQTNAADARALIEGFTKSDDSPNRSEWLRVAEEYARTYMPRGWRPPRPPDEGNRHA